MKILFKNKLNILIIILLALQVFPVFSQTEISDVYQRQFQGEAERRLLRLERQTESLEELEANIKEELCPIGIVITLGVSTNPADLFGFGTWEAIEGRVIVGIASSGTFDTLDETMGAETVTLSTINIPKFSLTVSGSAAYALRQVADGGGNGLWADSSGFATGELSTIGSTSPSAVNNIQPSIVKYVWQRVS